MRYFIWILLIVQISCKQKQKEIVKIPHDSFKLEIIDTVFYDFPYFKFASKFNSKLLGYNPFNNDVIIFDIGSLELSYFNNFGSGPEEYFLLYNNLGFTENQEIIIAGIKDFKIFDINGNFIKDFIFNRESTRAPVLKPFGMGNSIFGINLPQGMSSNPDFFKKQHDLLIKFDTNKESSKLISDFPFKKLNNLEGYYLNNGLIISYIDDKKLYLMDQNETVLRRYDLKSKEEEDPLVLDLEYFEPQLLPFGKKFTSDQLKFLSAMNSSLYDIFIQENLVFVIYDLAYTENEIQDYYKDISKMDNKNGPPIRYVLHVSDKEGNRVKNDIIIPLEFGRPIFACEDYVLTLIEGSNNNLLLKLKFS